MIEYIEYTGKDNESYTSLDLWKNGCFITSLRSYNFTLEIEEMKLCGEKYFRVSAYHRGDYYLFGINCDEITITEHIFDCLGELEEKKERTLKVE